MNVQQLINPMLVQYVFEKGQENVKSEPTLYIERRRKIMEKFGVKQGRR